MNEEFEDVTLPDKVNWGVFKTLFKKCKEFKKTFLIALFATAIVCLIETSFIFLISEIGIKQVLELGNYSVLNWLIPLLVFLVAGQGTSVYVFVYYTGKLELDIYAKFSQNTFDHLQEMPFSFYDKNSVGWLLARVTSDTQRLSEIVSWRLIDFGWAIFRLIFVVGIMIFIDFRLALLMLIIIPIITFVTIRFGGVMIAYSRKVRKLNSKITGALNEGISGAKTTKSLALEEKNLDEFKTITKTFRKTSVNSALINSTYYQIISISSGFGVALVAYFGGLQVIDPLNLFTVPTLFLFVTYTMSFFDPILNIARFSSELKQAQVSAERIFSLTSIIPTILDSEEVIEKYGTNTEKKKENWEPIQGNIEFKNVCFRYNKDSKNILTNFNLKVSSGQSIAIVGATGAGKSTIINLLCRFYEPTSGQILIDDKDYKLRSSAWLHSNLGYVLQAPHLFSGTIKENIRYGKLDATDEEIIQACKVVGIDDFILSLEKQYDTQVGEGGSKLSLGQKQLISFARAIINNPKLLILDEATSSIDTETEHKMQIAIGKLLNNRTSFIIAHRLSTITSSDLIIVLKKGEIIEQGTHDELLKTKGSYYELFTNQFIEEKLKEFNIISNISEEE